MHKQSTPFHLAFAWLFYLAFATLMSLFSSCNVVYKPLDKSNELPGARGKSIRMDNGSLNVLLWKERKKDTTEFEVHIDPDALKKENRLTVSLLKVELADYGMNDTAEYVLKKIKIARHGDTSARSNFEWITGSAVNQPVTLPVSGAHSCTIVYFFIHTGKAHTGKTHSYRKMKIAIGGFWEEAGKKASFREEIAFKKYLYVDIAGN